MPRFWPFSSGESHRSMPTWPADDVAFELARLRARLPVLEQENANLKLAVSELTVENATAKATIHRLEQEKEQLRVKLAADSSNSSKPPSSDGLRKKKQIPNLRQKTGRKSGGQPKHKGHHLKPHAHPDKIIHHLPTICACGCRVEGVLTTPAAARQVHDIPEPQPLVVTEHRVHSCTCPRCGAKVRGTFPSGVDGPVQYGPRLSSWMVYFCCEQYVPLERMSELLFALFGVKISEGTIVNKLHKCAEMVKLSVEQVLELLGEQFLIHVDETGMRAVGSLHWVHIVVTHSLTYYFLHAKRGADAFEELGLLPLFKGKCVHDFWKSYFDYPDIVHCLCVAHLLRELKMAHEQYHQKWAERMISLLIDAHDAAKAVRTAGGDKLDKKQLASFNRRYKEIVDAGRIENSIPAGPLAAGKRGSPQPKPGNLLARFEAYETEIFRFANDLSVPFDNNAAERAARMAKLKQKISGTFRGATTGEAFFQTKTYTATAKKQAVSTFDAIHRAYQGNPFMPRMNTG